MRARTRRLKPASLVMCTCLRFPRAPSIPSDAGPGPRMVLRHPRSIPLCLPWHPRWVGWWRFGADARRGQGYVALPAIARLSLAGEVEKPATQRLPMPAIVPLAYAVRMAELPAHSAEIEVGATADQVWRAITDPEITRQYMFHCDAEGEWTPGSTWRYHRGGQTLIGGTVQEARPPHLLRLSAHDAWYPGAEA